MMAGGAASGAMAGSKGQQQQGQQMAGINTPALPYVPAPQPQLPQVGPTNDYMSGPNKNAALGGGPRGNMFDYLNSPQNSDAFYGG
jgi:hypothetical protein